MNNFYGPNDDLDMDEKELTVVLINDEGTEVYSDGVDDGRVIVIDRCEPPKKK